MRDLRPEASPANGDAERRVGASTLLFLGDCYPVPGSRVELPTGAPFVINLDAALSGERPASGKVVLLLDELDLGACFGSLPVAVNLANNHSADGGEPGFARLADLLRSQRVAFFGAGLSSEGWNNPATLVIGDRTVHLFGYCGEEADPVFGPGPAPAPLDLELVRNDLGRPDLGDSFKVVCVHWGVEEAFIPRWEDHERARSVIDAGADAVVGCHPHCVQPIVEVGGATVAFSLGNAFFPDLDLPSDFDDDGVSRGRFRKRQMPWNRQSVALEIDPATGGRTIWPMVQRGGTTRQGRGAYHRLAERNPFADRDSHDRLARRDELRRARRAMLGRFLARPHLPRASTLRAAVGIGRRRSKGADG